MFDHQKDHSWQKIGPGATVNLYLVLYCAFDIYYNYIDGQIYRRKRFLPPVFTDLFCSGVGSEVMLGFDPDVGWWQSAKCRKNCSDKKDVNKDSVETMQNT